MFSILFSPLFIGWIVLSVVCGIVGASSRTGFWGSFCLAIILTPIVVLIVLYLFQPVNKGK
ncbi:hypothetical protein SAMN05216311_11288 [Chitinophaga sp. CF418]|nr:hypothetical protein SAMN05216311_11288 [Chitinophaga sp. CF418]